MKVCSLPILHCAIRSITNFRRCMGRILQALKRSGLYQITMQKTQGVLVNTRERVCEKYRNKAEMKTCKKNTQRQEDRLAYTCCICAANVHLLPYFPLSFCSRVSPLEYFPPCSVSVLFTGPSLLEMQFLQ